MYVWSLWRKRPIDQVIAIVAILVSIATCHQTNQISSQANILSENANAVATRALYKAEEANVISTQSLAESVTANAIATRALYKAEEANAISIQSLAESVEANEIAEEANRISKETAEDSKRSSMPNLRISNEQVARFQNKEGANAFECTSTITFNNNGGLPGEVERYDFVLIYNNQNYAVQYVYQNLDENVEARPKITFITKELFVDEQQSTQATFPLQVPGNSYRTIYAKIRIAQLGYTVRPLNFAEFDPNQRTEEEKTVVFGKFLFESSASKTPLEAETMCAILE